MSEKRGGTIAVHTLDDAPLRGNALGDPTERYPAVLAVVGRMAVSSGCDVSVPLRARALEGAAE